VPGLRRCRAAGALAALAAAVLTFALSAASARAAGPTIGPVQINPVGHPRLCWQAGGNGSGVTLERCDPALQGQQWSLTSDGVVMNGNGYCLEAGSPTALLPIAAVAGALLLAGGLLLYLARRRPRHAARSRSRSHARPRA
jgi:hypothetical protein